MATWHFTYEWISMLSVSSKGISYGLLPGMELTYYLLSCIGPPVARSNICVSLASSPLKKTLFVCMSSMIHYKTDHCPRTMLPSLLYPHHPSYDAPFLSCIQNPTCWSICTYYPSIDLILSFVQSISQQVRIIFCPVIFYGHAYQLLPVIPSMFSLTL
jgi:hypothetical protein